MTLTVITLTKDNFAECVHTLNTLTSAIDFIDSILVVFDGQALTKTSFHYHLSPKVLEKLTVKRGPGKGIYPAMNAALQEVTGPHIFLNSGDFIVGNPFDSCAAPPYFIPVLGASNNLKRTKRISPNRFFRTFNHQGLVSCDVGSEQFQVDKYKIAADFDLFLKINGTSNFPMEAKVDGFVVYNMNGLSSGKKYSRDLEYSRIYRNHGLNFQAAFAFGKAILNRIRGYR